MENRERKSPEETAGETQVFAEFDVRENNPVFEKVQTKEQSRQEEELRAYRRELKIQLARMGRKRKARRVLLPRYILIATLLWCVLVGGILFIDRSITMNESNTLFSLSFRGFLDNLTIESVFELVLAVTLVLGFAVMLILGFSAWRFSRMEKKIARADDMLYQLRESEEDSVIRKRESKRYREMRRMGN